MRFEGERNASPLTRILPVIATLTKRLNLRQRVTATASMYFRRFYARSANAYAATDPALVATACVYVAAKVEETPVHVRSVIAEAHKIWTGAKGSYAEL